MIFGQTHLYHLLHIDLITQLNTLDNDINHAQGAETAQNGQTETYSICFKLNEDDEIERLKQFYNTNMCDYYTKIDLYNVPQSSKPVIKFLEDGMSLPLDSFSFNLEGKDIKIEKYILNLMKRIVSVRDSLSINHCDFDFNSLTTFIDSSSSTFCKLKLLDLSFCDGIPLEMLASKTMVYKNLSSLILHHSRT